MVLRVFLHALQGREMQRTWSALPDRNVGAPDVRRPRGKLSCLCRSCLFAAALEEMLSAAVSTRTWRETRPSALLNSPQRLCQGYVFLAVNVGAP